MPDGLSAAVPPEAVAFLRRIETPLDGLTRSLTSSESGIAIVHLRRPLGRIRITTAKCRTAMRPNAFRFNVWITGWSDGTDQRGMHCTLGGKVSHHYGPNDSATVVEDVYRYARCLLYGTPREFPAPFAENPGFDVSDPVGRRPTRVFAPSPRRVQ